jgi:MFS family permease
MEPHLQRANQGSERTSLPSPDLSLRTAVLSLYLPSIIHSLCGALIFPILPLLALSLDVSYGTVGIAVAASGLGLLLIDIPSGVAIRRFGHKRTMLAGAVLTMVSALAITQVDSITELIIYRFVSGIGLGLWTTSRHTYLIDLFRSERRGRGSAMLGGVHRLTAVIGPLVGGYVADSFGLRAPFAVYAVFSLVAIVMVIFFVPGREAQSSEADGDQHPSLFDVLKAHCGSLLRAGPAFICVQVVRSARNLLVPLYGAEVVGLSATGIGVIISISYAADLVMVYPAGVIMDRWGRKFASVPSFLIQSVALAMLPLVDGFGSLLAVVTLMGFGNGIGSGAMITLGADLAPRKAAGEFLGLWRFVGDAGGAGGPYVAGEMADIAGLDASAFVIAGFGLGATALLRFAVPETLVKESAREEGAKD